LAPSQCADFHGCILQRATVVAVLPPIPTRRFDYCAYFDPEGLAGYGPTEQDALQDLLSHFSHDPELFPYPLRTDTQPRAQFPQGVA
jgi:hypothetical protein